MVIQALQSTLCSHQGSSKRKILYVDIFLLFSRTSVVNVFVHAKYFTIC